MQKGRVFRVRSPRAPASCTEYPTIWLGKTASWLVLDFYTTVLGCSKVFLYRNTCRKLEKCCSCAADITLSAAGSADGTAVSGEQRSGRSRRSTRKVTDFALMHEGNTQELTAKVGPPVLTQSHP